jgi:thymidylate synthase ThyX
MFDSNIRAELVWDGGDEVQVPSVMYNPAPNQMQGTAHERLGEVACRICYESMGIDPETGKSKGRSSEKLHEHILEVKNTSVYEHCMFTLVLTNIDVKNLAFICLNRPGVWMTVTGRYQAEITLNHRSVLEWDQWSPGFFGSDDLYFSSLLQLGQRLETLITREACKLAPQFYRGKVFSELDKSVTSVDCTLKKPDDLTWNQAWVSLYLSGSRGLSHEQCRHGDFSAISQRSTRFVDESDSPWVTHPLIDYYFQSDAYSIKKDIMRLNAVNCVEASRRCYDSIVNELQNFLKEKGVDSLPARKQARGAARGYLGNALFTDMIFSATVKQWKWMLSQRGSPFADAEIRCLYAPYVLECLQNSRYKHFFRYLKLEPSPDGIGQIVTDN